MNAIRILGTRGIPAQHGGFETFAESLSLYLVARGWAVTVYCQTEGEGEIFEDHWQGIRRVHVPAPGSGSIGTVIFDWRSTVHACKEKGLVLTLGYNTAVFCLLYRLKGIVNLINMDGLEWKRKKWPWYAKAWLYLNERLGCWLGNHLIADHPAIKAHLATRVSPGKITMIPYGADPITTAEVSRLDSYLIEPNQYGIVIARPEPENNVLEIVEAFSHKPRGMDLVVLGDYRPEENDYHRRVVNAASKEIKFIGAIYEKATIHALRLYARFYVHGHSVGGTNPSLVEALGASSPVLAHDNKFNRWVAGSGAHYFANTEECSKHLDTYCEDDTGMFEARRDSSTQQFEKRFKWETVHQQYEALFKEWLPAPQHAIKPVRPVVRYAGRASKVYLMFVVFSVFAFLLISKGISAV